MIPRAFRPAVAAVLGLALSAPVPALADQTDPRLDGLFERLQTTENFDTAYALIGEIWDIWVYSEDIDAQRDMRYGIDAMNAGQFRIAIAVYSEMLKRHPDFAEAWNKRATAYFIVGEYEKSIADCIRVLDLEPRHFGALSGLGMIYTHLEEPEVALAWYKRALDVNPHLNDARMAVRLLSEKLKGEPI